MNPTTPPVQQPQAPQYNHPCGYYLLIDGRDFINIAVPLYRATIAGDWDELARLIKHREHRLKYSITKNKETALHIAAMGQSTLFLKQIANRMNKEDMALQNGDGNTPLCLAAISGKVGMAKIILEKDHSMLTTRGIEDMMPLYLAALHVNHDMVTFLYHELHQFPLDPAWSDNDWYQIFMKCIEADFFDVALEILNDHKNSVLIPQDKRNIEKMLQELAQKPNAFDIRPHPIKRIFTSAACVDMQPSEATQLLKRILEIVIDLGHDIDDIFAGDSYKILFAAAKSGNAKFLIEVFRLFPDLIWMLNGQHQTIFHIAVIYRHERIYSILYEIGSMKDTITRRIDKDGNNMLHLAAQLDQSKSLEKISGAAYQMQREIRWFKEVEGMVPPSYKKMKNIEGLTPHDLFTQEHRSLCHDGEKWIKSIVNQSMVAAALIATIGFSVAFSVPGGYNQNTGLPIFNRNKAFIIYVALDALSFTLSSISILTFLYIMTSRFSEEDFLEFMPTKLILSQATLFLSIFTMMAAFSVRFFVTFHIVWRTRRASFSVVDSFFDIFRDMYLPIFIGGPTTMAVVSFLVHRYSLFINAIRAVYGPRYRFKPTRNMLYYKNPRF